jgi:hypothetical protein
MFSKRADTSAWEPAYAVPVAVAWPMTNGNGDKPMAENMFFHIASCYPELAFRQEALLNRSFDCELNNRRDWGSP